MYCTYNDILKLKKRNEIIDLVNDEGLPYHEVDLSSSTDACRVRIDEAITAADAEIDGYLRGRYSVPLSETPVIIKYISRALALESLYFRRMPDEMPESIVAESKTKRLMLQHIQKGMLDLGVETTDSRSASGSYKSNKSSGDKIFTNDVLDQY